MKTVFLPRYALLLRIIKSLQTLIIALTIPSASLADVNYYKALFINYFKHTGSDYTAGHNNEKLVQHT